MLTELKMATRGIVGATIDKSISMNAHGGVQRVTGKTIVQLLIFLFFLDANQSMHQLHTSHSHIFWFSGFHHLIPFLFIEGNHTSTMYAMIRDGKYADAVRALNIQVQTHPHNRAGLSLLGYCHYYLQDFAAAAQQYQELVTLCPDVVEYKVYYAQCLYKRYDWK